MQAMTNNSNIQARSLLFFSLFIFWGFGYETVVKRLTTVVVGVVVSSRDIPSTGAPRYATDYIIRGIDGVIRGYIAGPTDASPPRSMPVRTRIKKLRWELNYERDAAQVRDFPVAFYSAILGMALSFFVRGLLLLRRWRGKSA